MLIIISISVDYHIHLQEEDEAQWVEFLLNTHEAVGLSAPK